ncbi:MAG TPA: DNA methyltransferase [Armatimonadota bacterium]|nr:DNA methyltransferase [Armatimonadota bacterium]HPP73558.1 DNA methyltransferase [Armatimonadota bacterium]
MIKRQEDQEPLPLNEFENRVEKPPTVRNYKSLAYSDIDPARWREYTDIKLDSLWIFDSREKGNGHSFDYHGNYIPQIATQLFTRYTKQGDIVLDLFLGSGTTAIEALNRGRRCIGVELKPELVEHVRGKIPDESLDREIFALQGDSTDPQTAERVRQVLGDLGESHAQLLILHPPYWDIISFSQNPSDISNAESLEDFLDGFARVAKNGFDLLEPGRFAGLIIGDKYSSGELIPLGFLTMQVMTDTGFKLKSIVVKNIEGNEIGKGRTNNLWRYRALAGGFYLFKHEYVIIFEKPS